MEYVCATCGRETCGPLDSAWHIVSQLGPRAKPKRCRDVIVRIRCGRWVPKAEALEKFLSPESAPCTDI